MAKDANTFLSDILTSINFIEEYLTNIKSQSEYQNNFLITDAVARRLSIIGEALAKAAKLNSTINVSHQKKIISLRHIIVHDYDMVDDNYLGYSESVFAAFKNRN